jgi:hypothetical protein
MGYRRHAVRSLHAIREQGGESADAERYGPERSERQGEDLLLPFEFGVKELQQHTVLVCQSR